MNNKGFTLAEGLVAMVVLAVVTVGIFAAVLSSVRATKAPDTRENIAFAISQASQKIRLVQDSSWAGQDMKICEGDASASVGVPIGENTINCFLPDECTDGSTMKYNLDATTKKITFSVDCKKRQ